MPDSALIIVTFSKEATSLGSYFFYLTEKSETYKAFNFVFDPALQETPDSMCLGFASSDAMSESLVHGSILLLDSIKLSGLSQQPEQLNGDFEQWSVDSFRKPFEWEISDGYRPGDYLSQDAYEGQFALSLTSYAGYDSWDQFFI